MDPRPGRAPAHAPPVPCSPTSRFRVAQALGVLFALAGFVHAVVVVMLRLRGNIRVQGWSALMIVVLVLGGLRFLMLGGNTSGGCSTRPSGAPASSSTGWSRAARCASRSPMAGTQ